MVRSENFARQCLYDVDWQILRLSLLGTWSDSLKVKDSLRKIHEYVYVASGTERATRVWRCLNLLNAVLLGFGKSKPMSHTEIVAARDRYSDLHDQWWLPADSVWNWNDVRRTLTTVNEFTIRKIQSNLRQRVAASIRHKGSTDNRPELTTFMGMLEWELASRADRRIGHAA